MGTQLTLKAVLEGKSFKAPGHLLYLAGERYEIGFVEPYNRALGSLYVTPTQVIYWGISGDPQVFELTDTLQLSSLLGLPIPNWDIRDLLPFPVSGRSSGFQLDSMWSENATAHFHGTTEESDHTLILARGSQQITEERIVRSGREPVVKKFGRFRTVSGWPIARTVICTDTAETVKLVWRLNAPQLRILADSILPGIDATP